MDGGLFSAGRTAVDTDVVRDGFGIDVFMDAFVRCHKPARSLVAGKTIGGVGPRIVVSHRFEIDVQLLLASPFVDRLACTLLLDRRALGHGSLELLRRGHALIQDVVDAAVDEGLVGLQLA